MRTNIIRAASVVFALILGACATTNASALMSSAHAIIDWSTLDITTFGEGGLLAIDDPFIGNSALVTDEHLTPISAAEQLFAPAIAFHPYFEENAGFAGFEDDASAASASVSFGTASAESVLSTSFLAVGSGTALITVGYAAVAEIAGDWPEAGVAASSVSLGVLNVDLHYGTEDILFFDEAFVGREGKAGSASDTGYLTALFEFSASDYQIIRLNGSAGAFTAGAIAAPVPAALPLMLSAVGLVGAVTRRKQAG